MTHTAKGLPGLSAIREALGLSQAELAALIESHGNMIYMLESGRADCSAAYMRALAYMTASTVADLWNPELTPSRLAEIRRSWHLKQASEAV